MYLMILAAVALSPVIALLALLAFALIRVDCYGGIRVLGLRLNTESTPRPFSLAGIGATLRAFG